MTLAARFRDIAARYPDRVAVHDDVAAISYRALSVRAGGIARALSAAGLRPGERVGLLLEHGAVTVSAAIGTLAAGGCYVPLDPGYPADRLALMADKAGLRMLLTNSAGFSGPLDGSPLVSGPVFDTDDIGTAELEVTGVSEDQPAYVLYTSGSTGQPKGVAQTHRNVCHGVCNHVAGLGIGPQDKLSLLSSFSFDMAVTDMYAALLSGAAVVTVDVRRHGIAHLSSALADRGVTVYHSTPTAYEQLVIALGHPGTARLEKIRVVLLGGEHVTKAHVLAARALFHPGCVFVNGYGTTEASFAARYQIGPADPVDRPVVPIGYPLPGYDIVLLDRQGRQQRDSGEIAIRSAYLAPGYDHDQARTAERFSTDSDGTPVYRTGDYGTRLADSRLVCLGRTDRQVKIRGHRVELGEVEAHLAMLPGVAHAAVLTRGDTVLAGGHPPTPDGQEPPGGATIRRESTEIVGYVVAAEGATLDPLGLRRALAERLPQYLLPATIMIMSEFPLTPTGKVDMAALPIPPPVAASGEPPRTATERLVASAWREVLGLRFVAIDVTFFDLGGHSLAMTRLQGRLESRLGRRIPLVAIVEHPSVRAFAGYLDAAQAEHTQFDRISDRMARRRAVRVRAKGDGPLSAPERGQR